MSNHVQCGSILVANTFLSFFKILINRPVHFTLDEPAALKLDDMRPLLPITTSDYLSLVASFYKSVLEISGIKRLHQIGNLQIMNSYYEVILSKRITNDTYSIW